MYICTELDQSGNSCISWLSLPEFMAFPAELSGVKLGFMFLGIVASAYACKQIVLLILNR